MNKKSRKIGRCKCIGRWCVWKRLMLRYNMQQIEKPLANYIFQLARKFCPMREHKPKANSVK